MKNDFEEVNMKLKCLILVCLLTCSSVKVKNLWTKTLLWIRNKQYWNGDKKCEIKSNLNSLNNKKYF